MDQGWVWVWVSVNVGVGVGKGVGVGVGKGVGRHLAKTVWALGQGTLEPKVQGARKGPFLVFTV